jgi:hypothetical protein
MLPLRVKLDFIAEMSHILNAIDITSNHWNSLQKNINPTNNNIYWLAAEETPAPILSHPKLIINR